MGFASSVSYSFRTHVRPPGRVNAAKRTVIPVYAGIQALPSRMLPGLEPGFRRGDYRALPMRQEIYQRRVPARNSLQYSRKRLLRRTIQPVENQETFHGEIVVHGIHMPGLGANDISQAAGGNDLGTASQLVEHSFQNPIDQ